MRGQNASSQRRRGAARFAASGLPPGISIEPETGLITGRIADDAASRYRVTITIVSDEGSTEVVFDWHIDAVDESSRCWALPWADAQAIPWR